MVREFIFRNFWLKLFSLVLATLIWLAVGYNPALTSPATPIAPSSLRVLELCPVGILNPAGEGRPLRVEPSHVRITVRGSPNSVQSLSQDEVHAFVRIPPGRPATGPFAIEVMVPDYVSVAEILPSAVNVRAVPSP